jgi:hypothetical protein
MPKSTRQNTLNSSNRIGPITAEKILHLNLKRNEEEAALATSIYESPHK